MASDHHVAVALILRAGVLAGIGGCPHHQRAPAVHTALPVSPTRLLLLMLPTSNQETMLPGQVPGATGDALPGPSPAGADRFLRRDRAALRPPRLLRDGSHDGHRDRKSRSSPPVPGRGGDAWFSLHIYLVLFLSSDRSHGCRGVSLLRCGRRRSGTIPWSSFTLVSCEVRNSLHDCADSPLVS